MKFLALIATISLFGSALALFESSEVHLIIDAGHGGVDPGALEEGARESDLNLTWALELKAQAEEQGLEVTLIREDDHFIDLAARKNAITENKKEGSIFISIHQNHSSSAEKSGSYIYISKETPDQSMELAQSVAQHLNELAEPQVELESLFLLRNLDMPGLVISPGFISNESDLKDLNSSEFREKFNEQLLEALQK